MRSKAHKKSAAVQANYKKYFDRHIRHFPTFREADLMYLDKLDPRLSLKKRKLTTVEEIATVNRSKLMFKKKRRLRFFRVHPNKLVIDEEGIQNLYLLTV